MNTLTTDKIHWYGQMSWLYWTQPLLTSLILIISGTGLLAHAQFAVLNLGELDVILGREQQTYASFMLLTAAALVAAFSYVRRLSAGRYIITTKRVIERHGLIANHTSEVRLEDIRSVRLMQTAWQRMLGLGTVEIVSAATGEWEIRFSRIRNPQQVKALIHLLQDGFSKDM